MLWIPAFNSSSVPTLAPAAIFLQISDLFAGNPTQFWPDETRFPTMTGVEPTEYGDDKEEKALVLAL